MSLHIMRHGATSFNGTYLVPQDAELSVKGRGQVRLAGQNLEGMVFDWSFESELLRTGQTREILGYYVKIEQPPVVMAGLNEIDFGSWEGRRISDVTKWPYSMLWNKRYGLLRAPGGESLGKVKKRAIAAYEYIKNHFIGDKLIVTHRTPMEYILAYIQGMHILDIPQVKTGEIYSLENKIEKL